VQDAAVVKSWEGKIFGIITLPRHKRETMMEDIETFCKIRLPKRAIPTLIPIFKMPLPDLQEKELSYAEQKRKACHTLVETRRDPDPYRDCLNICAIAGQTTGQWLEEYVFVPPGSPTKPVMVMWFIPDIPLTKFIMERYHAAKDELREIAILSAQGCPGAYIEY
jgi:hypothetical protein